MNYISRWKKKTKLQKQMKEELIIINKTTERRNQGRHNWHNAIDLPSVMPSNIITRRQSRSSGRRRKSAKTHNLPLQLLRQTSWKKLRAEELYKLLWQHYLDRWVIDPNGADGTQDRDVCSTDFWDPLIGGPSSVGSECRLGLRAEAPKKDENVSWTEALTWCSRGYVQKRIDSWSCFFRWLEYLGSHWVLCNLYLLFSVVYIISIFVSQSFPESKWIASPARRMPTGDSPWR